LEEEKSPKLGLSLNTLASSKDKEMVDVDDTTETGNASLKVEELFANVLPPSAVEDDLVNQGMIVSCTDEQQTFVTQPASKMVDVLVEVSRQEDSSLRTEYGMEIRGDDSRGEAVRMQLLDNFVAHEDSSIVPIQVSCQASPKPYYIDSSMQSPEVTMGTVVGELNSVNKVASLSSNNSEQKMGTMPLKQHSIALNQDLVTEVNRKGDDIFYNLVHAGNQYSVLDAKMVEANSHGDVSNSSDLGELRHQQCLSLEPQMEVHFIDLEQAKVVVSESDQPLSNIKVVMLNKNIVQDEFEENSNAPGSTDKYKENPRLSSISEVVPSATTKNKEIVVDPEAALCDCAIQNEFQNSPTAIKDNESSGGSGVQETVPCVVVENEAVGIIPAFCKSSVQNKFEDSTTADKDNERSKELELQGEVHDGHQWERSRKGLQIYHIEPD
jgi:hypothetical protein